MSHPMQGSRRSPAVRGDGVLPGARTKAAPCGLLLFVTPHAGFEEEPRHAGRRSPAGGTWRRSPSRAPSACHGSGMLPARSVSTLHIREHLTAGEPLPDS